jgi:DNA polymerase (family 10)
LILLNVNLIAGKVLLMENLEEVLMEELKVLMPLSKKIRVVGSIRRKKPNPHDIDIVLIPNSETELIIIKLYANSFIKGNIGIGDKHVSYNNKGIEVNIFFATEDNFGAMLLRRTGPAGYNIGLSCVAKKKGLKLNEYGIFDSNGNCLASKTEEDIYKVLGKEWKSPELRGL